MCSQCLVLKPDGMIDVEKFCISCLVEHLRTLVKELLHVEDLPGNLPVFCYFKKIAELPSGSNLVMDKEDAVDVLRGLMLNGKKTQNTRKKAKNILRKLKL